ncbi:GTA TIM barrel-like domain protein [Rhodobacter phage RcZahn]|nr:GTA TIM barrel-like domain protein [Rhodobacter phage RcZahn]
MAAIVLGVVGTAIGGAIGGTFLGMTAAALGGAIGATIGGVIDATIFAPSNDSTSWGEPLRNAQIMESREGAPVPRIYGVNRVSGQVIWQTKFLETIKTTTTTTGGKGGGGKSTQVQKEYLYSVSCAIAICEGPIHGIGRIWADGNLIDLDRDAEGAPLTVYYYYGTESQSPNSHIQSKEGSGAVPAYKGIAYVVFEDLLLKDYGNRIPQFQFEVVNALGRNNPEAMESVIKGVTMIPGAGEFVYGTTRITAKGGTLPYYDPDTTETEDTGGEDQQTNKANTFQRADFPVALDQMEAVLPNAKTVALVVGWFGNDLRCGFCDIQPKIEDENTVTEPRGWSVGPYYRKTTTGVISTPWFGDLSGIFGAGNPVVATAVTNANLVSRTDGWLNYGGTPDDTCVKEAIAEMKSRGMKVVFYPFVFMDIPSDNTLPNPYSNNASQNGQPAHPWRGRITTSVHRQYTGTTNGTAAAATEVAAFFTKFRPFILHYANLCVEAGGVDAFLIGTEMVELNRIQDNTGAFPAVNAFKTLAADVKNIVGGSCKVGYASDWSEWSGYQHHDGSSFYFHLDPLYADSNVDFIGIDNYMPLSDWRDGRTHLDWQDGRTIYDIDYLQSNILGGEYYDWYYQSDTDRHTQNRTPITDGAYNKPWIYRPKDIYNFWNRQHYNRPGGVQSGSPTAWTPQSKPIWFTELGCGAIDKASNQPNVFFDPKSSESFFPHYSHGNRDDLIQRRFIEAQMLFWANGANNPTSSVYGQRMVDTNNIFIWTWDARPFPFFPKLSSRWGDVANWARGHWLNGRAGLCDIRDIIADIMAYQGFTAYDVSELQGMVSGYTLDRVTSARQAIENLTRPFFFDGIESNGQIIFRARARDVAGTVIEDDLVVGEDSIQENAKPFTMTRKQETELPEQMSVTYYDAAADYKQAQGYSRRVDTSSLKESNISLPFVMEQAQAIAIAEAVLIETWVARESGAFSLPPAALAYEPGDVLEATLDGKSWKVRIDRIAEAGARQVEFTQTDRSTYDLRAGPMRAYDGRMSLAEGTTTSTGQITHLLMVLTNGSPVLTSADGTDLRYLNVGQNVYGTGIPNGSAIIAIAGDGTSITISNNATLSNGSTLVAVDGQANPNLANPGDPTDWITATAAYVPVFAVVDIPMLTPTDAETTIRLCAYMEPWTEQVVTKEIDDGDIPLTFNGSSATAIESPNLIGAILTAVGSMAVQPLVWDEGTELHVKLHGNEGQLQSRTKSEVLQGFNTAFIEHTNGQWEVIQYMTATPGSESGEYYLTNLLRGQAGTEHLATRALLLGSRIVFNAAEITTVTLPSNELNVRVTYEATSTNASTSTNVTVSQTRALAGAGRRPYSPAALRLWRKAGGNDLRIKWVRRTRLNGDDWTPVEVPEDESVKTFKVQIKNGAGTTVLREIIVNSAEFWDYSAADQIDDFGSVQTSLIVAVSQYGSAYGNYGPALQEQLTIKGIV